MAKYNFEFKIKIVQKYLDGEGGYLYLAKKYGVRNETQIKNWVNTHKEFGEEGLLERGKIKNILFNLN